MSNKKTIFLTGGSGFIGKNIIELLGDKYSIFAQTHKELELLDTLQVEQFFKSHEIDIVIHGAVKPGHRNANDPSKQLDSNLRMFFNIARNSDKFKKMIFLSSGLVYSLDHYLPKMKEEYFGENIPTDESGFSKYITAKYISACDKFVELRIFGVFGKYEDYSIRFISNAICKALFDLPITIKQDRKFDYIYIDDLMPILDYFICNDSTHKAYNVTPDASIRLYELAEKVRRISGKNLPITVAKEGMGVEYSGDNSRLKKEISSLNFLHIDKAIERLYNWYSENKSDINYDALLTDK